MDPQQIDALVGRFDGLLRELQTLRDDLSQLGSGGRDGGGVGSGPQPVVFERPGVFHIPTEDEPSRIFNVEVSEGVSYRRIELAFTVRFGPWFEPRQDGLHSLFWLHRGRFQEGAEDPFPRWVGNLFGYGNLRGPGRNLLVSTTNVDLPRGEAERGTGPARPEVGGLYRVRYTYQPGGQASVMLLSMEDGREAGAVDLPATGPVTGTDAYMVYFGHELAPEGGGPEVPSFGTEYADLDLRFIP